MKLFYPNEASEIFTFCFNPLLPSPWENTFDLLHICNVELKCLKAFTFMISLMMKIYF